MALSKNETRLSITLPAGLKAALEEYAQAVGLSMSLVVRNRVLACIEDAMRRKLIRPREVDVGESKPGPRPTPVTELEDEPDEPARAGKRAARSRS